jgi:hypothetical protein
MRYGYKSDGEKLKLIFSGCKLKCKNDIVYSIYVLTKDGTNCFQIQITNLDNKTISYQAVTEKHKIYCDTNSLSHDNIKLDFEACDDYFIMIITRDNHEDYFKIKVVE